MEAHTFGKKNAECRVGYEVCKNVLHNPPEGDRRVGVRAKSGMREEWIFALTTVRSRGFFRCAVVTEIRHFPYALSSHQKIPRTFAKWKK
jgi:hypothetical protein